MRTSRPHTPPPTCLWGVPSRRAFLKMMAAASVAPPSIFDVDESLLPKQIPRTPTVFQFCPRYHYPAIRSTLGKMFDELGTVRPMVKNQFVTVKVNLVNVATEDVNGLPVELTVVTHPMVAMALGSLLVEYGAKQVTFCDQLPYPGTGEEGFAKYQYDPTQFQAAMDGKVRFENTRNLGRYKKYALVQTQTKLLAEAWEVNQVYTQTDVLVSLGKLKSHVSGGFTGCMKNLFGVPPSSLYGDDLGDEPDESATGYRSGTMHDCTKAPRTSVTTFNGQTKAGEHGFNVPRFIVDLNSAFPIHLSVIDGISTIQSAEGWWIGNIVHPTAPGLLIAGTNPVCTDAAAAAVMGFDPDAKSRTTPFANGTNYLKLARTLGLGENRIGNLEIGGVGLERAQFSFQPTYRRAIPS
ncbi:MAG: DUF362 domain-containing protein [bacterium]|nr:DUF362 domain-containing protein [bacterium]